MVGAASVARAHYLESMIIEEIQATNEIEAVHSSRQEISEALDALGTTTPSGPGGSRRWCGCTRALVMRR